MYFAKQWHKKRSLPSEEFCPSHGRHGSSLSLTAWINTRTHGELRAAFVSVTISWRSCTCKQTTTYHCDSPDALPRQRWQPPHSANHWRIEADVLFFLFLKQHLLLRCDSPTSYRCSHSGRAHTVDMFPSFIHVPPHGVSVGRRDGALDSLNVLAHETPDESVHTGGPERGRWMSHESKSS